MDKQGLVSNVELFEETEAGESLTTDNAGERFSDESTGTTKKVFRGKVKKKQPKELRPRDGNLQNHHSGASTAEDKALLADESSNEGRINQGPSPVPLGKPPQAGEASLAVNFATSAGSGSCTESLERLQGDTPSLKLLDLLLHKKPTTEQVKELLEKGADPTVTWSKADLDSRSYGHLFRLNLLSSSPLAFAVMHRNFEMVACLIEHNADLNKAEYSFTAGTKRVRWAGQPINLLVASGSLHHIESLVELRADLHTVGSNGATLLWQAVHFGHADISEYLINEGVRHSIAGENPDLGEKLYPIHNASRMGRLRILHQLADADADLNVPTDKGRTALDHAIDTSQVDAVYLLVKKGVRLLDKFQPRSSMCSHIAQGLVSTSWATQDKSFTYTRTIDLLFKINNGVVIEAAAKGLRDCDDKGQASRGKGGEKLTDENGRALEPQVSKLQISDLMHFLKTPGDAPRYIMSAIFRQLVKRTTLIYLDKKTETRVQVRSAFLQDWRYTKMNVAVGPPWEDFDQMVMHKTYPDQKQLRFLQMLAPQDPTPKCTDLARVDVWQCMIAGLHQNSLLLDQISRSASPEWFADPGLQAVCQIVWHDTVRFKRGLITMQVYHVLSWMALTSVINRKHGKQSFAVTCSVIPGLLYTVAEEVVRISVFGRSIFFGDEAGRNLWNLVRIALEIASLVCIGVWQLAPDPEPLTSLQRFAIAIVVYFQWMKLLSELCAIASVGFEVLPIKRATERMIGIVIVYGFFLTAVTHAYYAMDYHLLWDSGVLMWAVSLFGEIEYSDLENLDEGEESSNVYIRLFVMFVTFSMAIVLVNISVGVLGNAYNEAYEQAWYIFLQERFRNAVSNGIVLRRLNDWGLCFSCCVRRRSDDAGKYLYYCCETEEEPDGVEVGVEKQVLDYPAVAKLISEATGDIRDHLDELLHKLDPAADLNHAPRHTSKKRILTS